MTTALLKRLYVPVASLVFLILLGDWAVDKGVRSDPYAAANAAAQAQLAAQREESGSADALQFLFLGNSQAFTIQDPRPGDLTTPQWMQILLSGDESASRPAVKIYMGSEPNLTMTEVIVRLLANSESTPRRADALILQLVLDGFRMHGVRGSVLNEARDVPVRAALNNVLQQNKDLGYGAVALAPAIASPVSASKSRNRNPWEALFASAGDQIEAFAERWQVFAFRDKLRVQTANTYMHYRNALLRISSSSTRPIVETTYRANLELFEMILQYGKARNIPVAVYLAPVRPLQPNPLRPEDVARFRRDTSEICKRLQALCVDLIDAVPEQYWTNYPDNNPEAAGQPDFAHFTGAAHKKIAEELSTAIRPSLPRWA